MWEWQPTVSELRFHSPRFELFFWWWVLTESYGCAVGVVAVYALNDEFKSILRESKNGMVSPMSYVISKSIMVLPVIYIISLFALVIPGFIMFDYPWDSFGAATLIWSLFFFVFENLAECLAVWIEDPIIGMLQVRRGIRFDSVGTTAMAVGRIRFLIYLFFSCFPFLLFQIHTNHIATLFDVQF